MMIKKRILISILTALIVLSVSATMHANAILGDANLDSVLGINDAYAILEHSASVGAGNGGTLSNEALGLADYNLDGQVDTQDAFKILNYCFEILIPTKLSEINSILDELATIDKWQDDWKRAYSIQLTKFQSYENRYELADINNDSIPELFIMFYENTEDMPKTIVYTYQDGSCQQIYFPTESGVIDSWNMYVSTKFDGLFVWHYNSDVITNYKIDNLTAIPQYTLMKDYANDSYYFDDTPITKEEYNDYWEPTYWFDQFYYTTERDLLTIYGTGEVQANFIEDSIHIEKEWINFEVACNNITEKSNIIFHVVPHGSEHILENAIEYTDAKYDMTSLYEAVHSSCYGYCIFGEIPDGDYDLFMLADDGTELDSITFTVLEEDTRYKDIYKNKLASLSDSDSNYMYSLYDLNNDDIPELFISEGDYHTATVNIYTCINGSLKELTENYDLGSFGLVNISDDLLLSNYIGEGISHSYFYRIIYNQLVLQDKFIVDYNHNTYQYYDSDITEIEYKQLHAVYENLEYISIGRDYEITDTSLIDNY